MISKDYTIPLLGGLAIMCVLTLTIWGAIVGTIVLVVILEQALCGGRYTKILRRKIIGKKVFDIHFQPDPDDIHNIKDVCMIAMSPSIQNLCFSLYMKTALNLHYIRLEFKGIGEAPVITGLYDWYQKDESKPEDVEAKEVRDGAWYWRYHSPTPRVKESRTTIGIKCLAEKPFNGELKFTSTFLETQRIPQTIVFKVESRERTDEI